MAIESATNTAITTSAGAIAFDRVGAGRPVILLHDFASSRKSFAPMVDLLSTRFQVIAMDLLGHGGSCRSPRDLSIAAQARALGEVMLDLDLEGAAVVGHSLGGSVALRLAQALPERISRLVLISAGVYYPTLPLLLRLALRPLFWGALGLVGRRRVLAAIESLQRRRIEPGSLPASRRGPGATPPASASPGLQLPGSWWTLGRSYRAYLGETPAAEMEELLDRPSSHPTLVIWGDQDRLLPIGEARSVFQGRPRVRFVEIEGGSHAVHEDEPGLVAELVRGFVD